MKTTWIPKFPSKSWRHHHEWKVFGLEPTYFQILSLILSWVAFQDSSPACCTVDYLFEAFAKLTNFPIDWSYKKDNRKSSIQLNTKYFGDRKETTKVSDVHFFFPSSFFAVTSLLITTSDVTAKSESGGWQQNNSASKKYFEKKFYIFDSHYFCNEIASRRINVNENKTNVNSWTLPILSNKFPKAKVTNVTGKIIQIALYWIRIQICK